MNFEFATATRILFGNGAIGQAGEIAAGFGRRALVAAGGNPDRLAPLRESLDRHQIEAVPFAIRGEPSVEVVEAGIALAREQGCEMVIGYGGGSPLDAGKAIAAMLGNPGELFDYLEIIGRGGALTRPSVPFIAIPTTAGTGSEVTRNAVLSSARHQVKVSLRGPSMLARAVIVDPELTWSVPPAVTAATGLDALTQVMEPFVSHAANPLTDALCREGMVRAARSLQRAYQDGRDGQAREDMAITSLFGGLALANAKLGAVHGFAGPLGGMYDAPHGAICAALLPHVMAANVAALAARAPANPALARYDEVARLLIGDPSARAADGVAWIDALCRSLDLKGLGHFGLTPADFPTVVEKAAAASSMKGNPLPLTPGELTDILAKAL